MDAEGRKFPSKGCELRSREVIRTLGQVPADWRLGTFATGFMKRALRKASSTLASEVVSDAMSIRFSMQSAFIPSAAETMRQHDWILRELDCTYLASLLNLLVSTLCAAVVPEQQVGAFTVNQRGSKVVPKPSGGLIMTTSLWPEPCAKKFGDLANQLSIVNKVKCWSVRLHRFVPLCLHLAYT